MDDWTCKICGRKIGWFCRIFGFWIQTDERTDDGKVHRWCYNNEQKNKGEPSTPIFA
ncbi:MAG: hypothetical protein Q8N22_01925 [bacterium]|nr:hypothetical protein [bacterium]